MRQVYLDLTAPNPYGIRYIGNMGEHNATELILGVPQDMLEQSDYVTVLFQTDGMVFRTQEIYPDAPLADAWLQDCTVHVLLSRMITSHVRIALQVEGYKTGENGCAECVMKTPMATGLAFRPAASGIPAPISLPSGKGGTSGVSIVEDFSQLSEKAQDGSLALVLAPTYSWANMDYSHYDSEHEEYTIANKTVSLSSDITENESALREIIERFMEKYPIRYIQYWSGATLERWDLPNGVFRKNDDDTYTDVSDQFHVGDPVGGYYYADRDRSFYIEAYLSSTDKDDSVTETNIYLGVIPIVEDEKNNFFTRNRIEPEGFMDGYLVNADATSSYVLCAMRNVESSDSTIAEWQPDAVHLGGNYYRLPILYLYAFEDLTFPFNFENEDEFGNEYMDSTELHLCAGWNALYINVDIVYDERYNEYEFGDRIEIAGTEPCIYGLPFEVITDETGYIEFNRQWDQFILGDVWKERNTVHPSGLYIKNGAWQPVDTSILPMLKKTPITSLKQHNHSNKELLDNLYYDGSGLRCYGSYVGIRPMGISQEDYGNEYRYGLQFSNGMTHYFNVPKANTVTEMKLLESTPGTAILGVHYEDGGYREFSFDLPRTNQHLYIRYASSPNGTPEYMHDAPEQYDTYMGLCLTDSDYAPTDYGSYQWIRYKTPENQVTRDRARLDYLDMMTGIRFDESISTYAVVRDYYYAGYWTATHLRHAVEKNWIDADTFRELSGMEYSS